MNISTRMLLPFIATMLLMPLTACALSGGALEGKVLEAGTNKPIPEAIVIARWTGDLAAFAESQTVCVHVLTTTTDAQGTYRFPAWRKQSEIGWVRNVRPVITAHKPGHEEYRPPGYVRTKEFKQNIRYLKPFAGGREERFKYLFHLDQTTASCRSPEAGEKNLAAFYRALYEEMKMLAESREEADFADGYLRRAETLELGRVEAERRARARTEQRNRQPLKSDPSALEGIIIRPSR